MRIHWGVVVLFSAIVGPKAVSAEDFFLTIGGGYDATGNQVSLERNVVFQQSVLDRQRPDKPKHEIYFADGDDKSRDLQYRDPQFFETCPPARRLMAELLGDESTMDLVYRNHKIEGETGPADRRLLERRLSQLGGQLKSGDRLFIYATAHGGGAERQTNSRRRRGELSGNANQNEYDTSLYMWSGGSVKASVFESWLDRLPYDVEVVMVMVQCYSGGFSHTIFDNANADKGLSPHRRCGFYSQVHNLPAAGCTPDVDENDYQEYSSFFWAALGGQTRGGAPITTADYDGDGAVSFAEAHAYAVIESDTIDIPICTSGEFLRHYSVLNRQESKVESSDLMEVTGSLEVFAKRARPEQRAVLLNLSRALNLQGTPTVEAIKARMKQVKAEETQARAKYSAAQSSYSRLANNIVDELETEWPELESTYSPTAMALCSERSRDFMAKIESLPDYAAYERARDRNDETYEAYRKFDHLDAKAKRLLRTCENIVLEANLDKVATSEIIERYQQLRDMENGLLAPTR